jgi:hypothetical protein
MALARNLILVLAAAATPALAQPKPAAVAPTPAPAPAAATPAAAPTAPGKDDWPTGAPRSDYEFTAWCYGVLRQHMELYNQVKPELAAISKRWKTEEEDEKSYGDQIAAGRMYLAQFAKAIEAAEKASPRPINTQGAAAIEQGRKMWAQFNTVDKTMQAYSWMNWELPEKCPKVAASLENRAMLMAPALRANQSASGTAPPAKPAESRKAESAAAAKPSVDAVGALIKDAGKPSKTN